MALKIVKGSIDRMFDKNLQDLVRGIRNHKEDEVKRPGEHTPTTETSYQNLVFIDVSVWSHICPEPLSLTS